jgi:anti-anti-sigma factor
VPLPAEIDVTNARQADRDLLAAVVPGVTAVIADMTATTFCDSSGVRMLALVHQLAVADQAQLILVVPSARMLRILSLTGLDQVLRVYPSLDEALSAESVPQAGATR